MNAVIYGQVYERKPSSAVIASTSGKKSHNNLKLNSQDKVERIIANIIATCTDITGDYNQWFQIGCALANEFGEDGREMFHSVSQYSDKYKYGEADRQFTNCLRNNYTSINIGTFFYYAAEVGLV